MQFIKTLFWVILAILLVVFAANNWERVSVNLWGGLTLDTKMPVLVIGAFLLGFVPLYIVHRAMLWRMRRRTMTTGSASTPYELNREQAVSPPPPPVATHSDDPDPAAHDPLDAERP